jgi:beta-galactosidase
MRCLVAILGLTFPAYLPANAAQESRVDVRDERILGTGWKFSFGATAEQAITPEFDDSAWQSVSVPHTWNRLGEYRLQRTAATNNQRGIGWYRLRFKAPASRPNQRYFLQFEAVATLADVYLNGQRIGSHAGAFSRFRFDVTDVLRLGETNLLVVKADNTKPAPGASTQDVIPLGGDFFVYGGVYRPVSLIVTSAVHIDMLDYAGPGVYVHTARSDTDSADIAVLTRLRNDGRKTRKVNVSTHIVAADGSTVASNVEQVSIRGAASAEVKATLSVTSPRLWNGRADPYLYSVRVEVAERSTVLDTVTQPLGIRTFSVDPNRGFVLNGKPLRLRGVSRHQDRAGKGWALSKADHQEDMSLIAEVGANAVRFAHYQHAPEWFELADRYGMAVWSEVPFVNEANFTPEEATPTLVANARQQLIEAIRQNYNHPSVITWSVGNEIDIGSLMKRGSRAGKSRSLLSNLHELAKQEDPTRPTVFADCCESPPMKMPVGAEQLAGITDLIAYNRYFGWYYGKPAALGSALDTLHERHPMLPIGVSEYGAGGALTQHSDNLLGGPVNVFGRPHPEEFQSWYHEQSWPEIESREFVWGSWIWNMFDFASDLREEGDAVDINDKGLVTFDRKTKKDAFFYYKAQWSSDPVVHINSARYTERAYSVTDVRVYSNASSVRLKLNDADLGSSTCEAGVCVWREVRLRAGPNTLAASAEFSGRVVTDTVQWNALDAAGGLRINSGDVFGHAAQDGTRFGSDNFFLGGESKLLNEYGRGSFGEHGASTPSRKVVAGASSSTLHDAYRTGAFSYDIPLPNGNWRVTLYAFEPTEELAESRTFNVIANERLQVKAWSPGKLAGGALKAAQISFKVRVNDGRLRLQFEPDGGPAVVSAIVIGP